jgi:DNA-binding NarL/FixJ family response regulator
VVKNKRSEKVCDESVSNPVQAVREFEPRAHAEPRRQEFGLSEGELEAIALVVSGYTNKGIARKLAISESAVQHHLTNILNRLEVLNRFELILFSMYHHLTDDFQIN